MITLESNKRIVILSAEQAGRCADANADATDDLRDTLAGYLRTGLVDSVIACDGQYKGAPEHSFLVICDADSVSGVTKLANAFYQECVLVGTPCEDGAFGTVSTIEGALHFPNGDQEAIGNLTLCEAGRGYEASTTIHGTDITFTFE